MNDSEAEFLREMELLGFNKPPQLDIVGMPTIKSSELVKVRKIGSGQYGDVYEGKFIIFFLIICLSSQDFRKV